MLMDCELNRELSTDKRKETHIKTQKDCVETHGFRHRCCIIAEGTQASVRRISSVTSEVFSVPPSSGSHDCAPNSVAPLEKSSFQILSQDVSSSKAQNSCQGIGFFLTNDVGSRTMYGFNRDTVPRLMFREPAKPIPPCNIAPKSVTISPNRLLVTTTSNCPWTT